MQLDPGGGDYVGIDPQLLGNMISSMSSSAGTALNLVNSYIGRLSQVGLDTSSLSKAARDLTWALDQVPMLDRRQSIAQAMQQQDPGLGSMVPGGAGALDFATNQAAQAAGKAAGAKALQALEQQGNTDFILSDLTQYADDPAYLAAYFQALGPQGLASLGLQVIGYQQQGQDAQYQGWAGMVGNALATASYQMPFTSSFLSHLQLPNGLTDGITPQLSLIQPFLENGVYSSTWLRPLGQYALQQAYFQGRQPGMELPVHLDGIWTAIANNPAFAAQFYRQNFTNSANPDFSLSGIMTNPVLVQSICDSAFAGMVRAATIPPAGSTDTGPFAANAQLTVRYFGDNPSLRTSDPIRAAFGAITLHYFDDLANSVRAAAPGIGGQNMPNWQITAPVSEWGNFVIEAMRDKTTAARLLTFYSAWVKVQPIDWRGRGQEQVPRNQGFWNDTSMGLLDDFMAHNYQVAGAPAGDSSGIADVAAAAGSAFLTGLLFGPEASAASLLLDAGREGFKKAAETTIRGVWPSSPKPTGSSEALAQLTGVQQQWAYTVNLWYNGTPGQNQGPPPIDPVTYLGQAYTGDPTAYEKQYGGYFTDSSGQIMDPAQIAQNPEALAAYNAWLKDPAIVNANEAAFSQTQIGKLMSQYATGYSGSP
jgi:hypothetical protein